MSLEWFVCLAELLEHLMSEHFKASKVTDQLILEFLPIVDIEECTLFVERHGLEKKLDFC